MIEIRPEQFEALATASRREFDRRLIEHLREDLVDCVGPATDEQLFPMIGESIRRANRHGLTTEFEVVCFLDAAYLLQDFDFDSRPKYAQTLSDRNMTIEARAERIIELASETGKKIVTKLKDKFSMIRKPNEPCEGCPTSVKKSPLRNAYEKDVRDLKEIADKLKSEGKSSEEIARQLHRTRRGLDEKYRELTLPDKLAEIQKRNLVKFGDKHGPTIEHRRKYGKTWDDIIESASRPAAQS